MARERPTWMMRFWAVVRYEMLWNIRKKRFIGALIFAFVFASIQFALPAFFNINANPYFAVTFQRWKPNFCSLRNRNRHEQYIR